MLGVLPAAACRRVVHVETGSLLELKIEKLNCWPTSLSRRHRFAFCVGPLTDVTQDHKWNQDP